MLMPTTIALLYCTNQKNSYICITILENRKKGYARRSVGKGTDFFGKSHGLLINLVDNGEFNFIYEASS